MAGASTLPGSWYTDARVLDAELELVFGRSWHYAGHTGDLAERGGWFPGKAGATPVLVTRSRDGRLRALLAVCRHQGAVINPPPGAATTVRCAYHGWEYRLDGSLAAAPGFYRRPGFDPAARALPELPVGTWGPLVLVGGGDAVPPLADALGDLPQLLAAAELRFDHRSRARLDVNWKRGVEDALARGARLVFPATTVEASPGRLEIGTFAPAGPGATERLVDSFASPAVRPDPAAPGDDAREELARRLREALGAR